MHRRRAGLEGLRMSMLRVPLRYRPLDSAGIGCSNNWCSEGVVLGESSSRPERHLLYSSAQVNNERNERHAICLDSYKD